MSPSLLFSVCLSVSLSPSSGPSHNLLPSRCGCAGECNDPVVLVLDGSVTVMSMFPVCRAAINHDTAAARGRARENMPVVNYQSIFAHH